MFRLLSVIFMSVLICVSYAFGKSIKAIGTQRRSFSSKIGIHLIGNYTPGTQKMVRARMPVLKILDPWQPMIDAARDYKKYNPDGIVVLRCYTPVRYELTDNPEEKAQEFWDKIIWPRVSNLPPEDRKLIDYIEANNEYDNCPAFATLEDVKWYTRFSIKFAEICSKAGYKPCLACIPVGNPSGTPEEIAQKILAYVPALRAIKKVGGVWSYHAYTLQYTTDPQIERSYSLRYRRFYELFKGPYADLADMPMILTEGGVDKGGNKDTDGWQARGTAEQFKNWLKWFDSELKKDKYIIGVTLFENGDPVGWKSFDLEPLADWFVEYWGK
jgi:hypothetical protein